MSRLFQFSLILVLSSAVTNVPAQMRDSATSTSARTRDSVYLEMVSQLMRDYRDISAITRDTLFISKTVVIDPFCYDWLKDTTDFSAGDSLLFCTALKQSALKHWTPDLVGSPATIVNADSLITATKVVAPFNHNMFYLKIKNLGIWYFSPPVFFKNSTLAIICVFTYGGTLSSSSNTYVFRKVDGHWKIVRTFCSMIS